MEEKRGVQVNAHQDRVAVTERRRAPCAVRRLSSEPHSVLLLVHRVSVADLLPLLVEGDVELFNRFIAYESCAFSYAYYRYAVRL